MSDGGKNGRLVLHSRVSGKLAEIERQRGALAFLLEEIDSLWESDAIADRLEADGFKDVAKAYRFAAKEHRECAERITRGALEGFFDGLNERLAKDGDGKE